MSAERTQDPFDRYVDVSKAVSKGLEGGDSPPIELLLDRESFEAAMVEAEDASKGVPPVGIVLEDTYLLALRDLVRFPSGTVGTYLRLYHKPVSGQGAVVIPVLPNGDIVFVRHYRHATQRWHYELPRGFASTADSAAATAEREVLEELGADTTTLTQVGSFEPDSGLFGSSVCAWVAEIDGVVAVDTEEGIESWFSRPWADILTMIAAGDITDGQSLAALMIASAQGLIST